ncbi:MAG TPA: MBL fold metallo-hydrolase [Anaerovoracaceae bacterium]|nr:MBL fold metallo-hydrolase [Anaerovoracaceae bacterium]
MDNLMIKKITFGHSICYLIKQDDNFMLIDAEMPGYSARLISKLERAGVTRENFKLLILTHGHVDHVGNAHALRKHFGVRLAIGREDAPLIETADLTFPKAHNMITKVLRKIVMLRESKFTYEPFEADLLLENDQNLNQFGFDAAVISLSGHTPGSIGVILGGHIFTGDASMSLGGRTAPSIFGEDMDQMKLSLKRIERFSRGNIHNGH